MKNCLSGDSPLRVRGKLLTGCLIFSLVLPGCQPKQEKSKQEKSTSSKSLFSILSPENSGIKFINTLTETDSESFFTYQYFYNGSGVAASDINNDGLPDLFFAANQSSCRLYLNKGNLKFEDITEKAGVKTSGWCSGVSMADVNGDGYPDIYVCRSFSPKSEPERRNLLFINNRNLTFTESAKEYGLDDPGFATQAYFFDADNDGDLDMYLVNHGNIFKFQLNGMQADNAKADPLTSHKFYRNNGNNKFTDNTILARLQCNTFGLSAAIADINNDGYPDIYASNDYTMPDFVYINNKDGTFSDQTDQYIKHMSEFSMGSDAADFNNDGLTDLFTLDMLPEDNHRHKMLFGAQNYDKYYYRLYQGYRHQRMQNCLQLNNGNGTFSDIALLSGVAKTDWSWATLFVDLDNDGKKDLFITNGYLRDVTDLDFTMYRSEEIRKNRGVENRTAALLKQMPVNPLQKYVYRNNGNLTFSKMSDSWGFSDKHFSIGAAYADLDNDGDMDMVVNNLQDTASIYANNANELLHHHYLKIKLEGAGKNRFGIGATVTIFQKDSLQLLTQMPTRGYQSSVDYVLNFGLGTDENADSLVIKWNDGKEQLLKNIKADQILTLNYKDAVSNHHEIISSPKEKLFTDAAAVYNINFRHKENDFIDFKREPLLPHKFSQGGPFVATGDVNGDKLDDFFVGNAKGSSGKMFLQNANGKFSENKSQPWGQDKMQEDMGCLLFDADGDKDLDLYVVSGGAEENGNSDYYQDRLYVNDGKGNFTKCKDCLPKINSSGSCVVAADYDGDGDLDLFRGGRIAPSLYPYPANSYLLRNDHGKFTDVIKEAAPDLRYPGLVNAAVWFDFNNDKAPDLVITGEWMPVMFFENQNGKLVWINKTQEGEYTRGWWNSLAAADFDNDGDIDFIAGNYGLNLKLKASVEKPLSIVAKDFDNNGTLDAIISNYEPDGKSYPIYSRDDLTDQIRPLKKTLLRYADYADKTIDQIFPADSLKDANYFACFNLASCYIENKGGGKFEFHQLPLEAQITPVCGILIQDFNGDKNPDVLLAGNSFSESVELGMCDAGIGLLLTGDGKGNFKPVRLMESGFFAYRDAKCLAHLKINQGNKELIIVANNNDALQVFEANNSSSEKKSKLVSKK